VEEIWIVDGFEVINGCGEGRSRGIMTCLLYRESNLSLKGRHVPSENRIQE
jgi:hypothetical protein